ncbi:MAG: PorT family protein [Rikenellaceae bacterium]|jgi:hypothetical protein|nr:PorT family protein [Rikenellaceae bacterium]
MKKLILTILTLAAMPLASQAQHTTTPPSEEQNIVIFRDVKERPNQMSVRVAGYELLLERDYTTRSSVSVKKFRRPYGGRIGTWELGFNGFDTRGNSYSMYPTDEKGFMELDMAKSLSLTMNMFTFATSFTRNNALGLTMAVGFTSNNYVFDTQSRFAKAGRMIHPVAAETLLKKSKLSTLALHVPLALEINPSRNFFFSVGGYVDLVLKSRLKSKFPKEKVWSPYTNFLQAGVTARAGFRNLYLFANYGLTDMFKDGRGPALNPYTFGFGFGF